MQLLGLENLWKYKYQGHKMGENLLMYDLIGQGLPSTHQELSLWLDKEHVALFMPKIRAANDAIAALPDPSGLKRSGGAGSNSISTIIDGFRAIREFLFETFEYKESNYKSEGKLVVDSKEDLSEKQLEILSSLVEMNFLWLFMGYSAHHLPNSLRDIGLALDFPKKMTEDNVRVQRSLYSFLTNDGSSSESQSENEARG